MASETTNPFDWPDDCEATLPPPRMAVYCPGCGAYVLLLGDTDFECDQCGGVFTVEALPPAKG